MIPLDKIHDKVLQPNKNGYMLIGIRSHHWLYKKQTKNAISFKLYQEILEFIFIKVWQKMIKERYIFTPPLKFGQFYILERLSSNGTFKDWKATVEKGNGKVIKSYNFHTSGRSFSVKWNRLLARIVHKTYYRFIPYRGSAEELAGNRGLASWIKQCSEDPKLGDFRAHLM